jgi:hypothetical protein
MRSIASSGESSGSVAILVPSPTKSWPSHQVRASQIKAATVKVLCARPVIKPNPRASMITMKTELSKMGSA